MTRPVHAADALVRRLEQAVMLVSFVLMGTMALAGIVFRLASIAVPWTNELAQYSMIWLVFTGASLGIHGREHVAMTALVERCSRRWQRRWRLVTHLAFLGFCGYLVVAGARLVNFQRLYGGSTVSLPVDIPVYVISSIMPLAFLGGVLHVVRHVFDEWVAWPNGAGGRS